MRVKPGAQERVRALMAEYEALQIPGLKGQVVYRSDRDPAE